MNLVNPKSSDSYNPLSHIRSEIDVDVIAATVVKGQKKEGIENLRKAKELGDTQADALIEKYK